MCATAARHAADPILGITEAFLKDKDANKINLGVVSSARVACDPCQFSTSSCNVGSPATSMAAYSVHHLMHGRF